jgi:hypothetical protein
LCGTANYCYFSQLYSVHLSDIFIIWPCVIAQLTWVAFSLQACSQRRISNAPMACPFKYHSLFTRAAELNREYLKTDCNNCDVLFWKYNSLW